MGVTDVYARRRLAAVCLVVAALVIAAVVLLRSCGGTDQGAKAKTLAPPPRLHQALVATAPKRHVKLPRREEGEGPFWTVENRTVQMRKVPQPGKQVALTFDDGPDLLTSKFLDILHRLHVKATFFVVGLQVGQYPQLVRREAYEGHTIGNHTYGHESLPQLSPRDQRTTILRTQGMLEESIGHGAYFFRFPAQRWDFASMRHVAQLGLVPVYFSIDTQDWRSVGSAEITDRALQAKPGDVIQMHDGGPNREQVLEALPRIVRGLRRKGYRLVTLDEMYRPVAKAATPS